MAAQWPARKHHSLKKRPGTHAEEALPTNLAATLITELVTALNSTNKAVNELKKLANGIVDDLQSAGLAK